MFGPLIADGQYWRLLTAIFLHIGILHILLNSLALFIFGRMVERYFGHTRFIAIYFLAGLGGSVASYLFNSIALAAGASGAIFGLLGASTAFFFIQRNTLGEMAKRNLYSLLILAVLNLYIGLVFSGIDNWAHFGGFVSGGLLGLILAPQYKPVRNTVGFVVGIRDVNSLIRRWWGLAAVSLVIVAGAWLATATLPDNALTRTYEAERLYEQGEYDAALDELNSAQALDSFEPQVYYVRGKVLAEVDSDTLARANLRQAIRLARLVGDNGTFEKAQALLDEIS